MVIFNMDLDNTLIFSYKHHMGPGKKCVEIYQDREISFITQDTFRLLKEIVKACTFVPTTTRTKEQYDRIDLGIGVPEYALVCNGGVLLENGKECDEWYQESLKLVSDCQGQLAIGQKMLEEDKDRSFEVRNIRNLFLFTKSASPIQTMGRLRNQLDLAKVDVFNNGIKVYVVPKELNKGSAVLRLKRRLGAKFLIAAGDSEFDVPMLWAADHAIAPKSLEDITCLPEHVTVMKNDEVFSEYVLRNVLHAICEQ